MLKVEVTGDGAAFWNRQISPQTQATHMSILLQKGGDFMTLIRTPFKKKRSTVAGDGKRSPSMTPKSARGSTARSNSVGSSVNSYEESEHVCEIKNIYADIDDVECDVATNKPAKCEQEPPELPAANVNKLKVLQVSTISECEYFEETVDDDFLKLPGIEQKLNCSKNNLLLVDDHLMTTSIDNHLNSIELINKNLDKLMETHQMIENDDQDEASSPDMKAEKKKLREKIAEKIRILKEARMMSPSSSDATIGESFKSRVKNIFPKFEKQTSQDDEPKVKSAKGFLSSFKKKTAAHDETDDDFEEIKKVPSDTQLLVTEAGTKVDDGKGEKLSSKFRHKLKLNVKSMISSKMSKKTLPAGPQVCKRCAKKLSFSAAGFRIHPSKAVFDFDREFHTTTLFDNDFCVCVDVFDEFDDDGICIKNFEYKDVSCGLLLFIWHEISRMMQLNFNERLV